MSPHPLWHEEHGLRIWRCADSRFYGDEILEAAGVYTDEVFAEIAATGFNAIWLRGKLRLIADSDVLPELNNGLSAARRESLRRVIEAGRRHGVGVFLFFNEPLALPVDSPFWEGHPELAGQRHRDYGEDHDCLSLCTSQPLVRSYMSQAINGLFDETPGLGGVILITASEYHTHCWSHQVIHSLNDGITNVSEQALTCPRCRDREPAAILSELITIWRDAAADRMPNIRVLCWNWSWSMWYTEPQTEVYRGLPAGIEILADFDRGSKIVRRGLELDIDEYSLSVVGPSDRFKGSAGIARGRGLPVHAKLQLGTTHEIGTVPNLPLIEQLHGKFVGLSRHDASGFMGTWNFGCSLTLNTAAVNQYLQDPRGYESCDRFMRDLATAYFGDIDADAVVLAWRTFGRAFENYPFSIKFLYFSPINYAPAYMPGIRYEARPMGMSCYEHAWGDRLDDSIPQDIRASEVAEALEAVACVWCAGLEHYGPALTTGAEGTAHGRRRREELSCARMIALQVGSAANIYRYHAWRENRMHALGITPPCDVPVDEESLAILRRERGLAAEAVALCRLDPRLGYHQESHAVFYDETSIAQKVDAIDSLINQREL